MTLDVLQEILNRLTAIEQKVADLETKITKKPPKPKAATPPPYEDLFALWNKTPNIKPAQAMTTLIRQRMAARWNQHPTIDWFAELFTRVGQSRFLTGGTCDFIATLDWVLRPQNADKIMAGNYDNQQIASRSNGHAGRSIFEEFLHDQR